MISYYEVKDMITPDDKRYDLDICFLSIMMPPENDYYKQQSKRFRSQNITAVQMSILNGLKEVNSSSPWVVNTPLVSLFPKGYKTPVVHSRKIDCDFKGINHSFLNFSPAYSSSLFYGAKKHLKKWAKKRSDKQKIVIAYALTTYTCMAMSYIKSIDPKIKTAIIVPDLPQFTYRDSKNPLLNLKNHIGRTSVCNTIKRKSDKIDVWLLFSDKMKEELPALKRSMVFEGIATDIFNGISSKTLFDEKKKTILYAGGLHTNYGVKLLLEAFSLIKGDDWRLILAGTGELVNEIKMRSEKDTRIIYKGEIPREELLALEKSVDLLVNPRVNSGIFTRYSFPSKNMEYLSSGTPMLGYKLDGIPDEYDRYINYFTEDSPKALSEAIQRILGDDYGIYVEKIQ